MGFIKHALIGIVLYEAVKYFLNDRGVLADTRQNDPYWKENVVTNGISAHYSTGLINESGLSVQDSGIDLLVGTNPETPLTGPERLNVRNDAWQNSLANDELRAPDS